MLVFRVVCCLSCADCVALLVLCGVSFLFGGCSLVGVRCSQRVASWLLLVVRCALRVVRCVLFVMCCLLLRIVWHSLRGVRCVLFVDCWLWFCV